jgi:hypothetical protein
MAPGRRIERIAIGNGTELAHQDLQHSSNRAVVSRLIYGCYSHTWRDCHRKARLQTPCVGSVPLTDAAGWLRDVRSESNAGANAKGFILLSDTEIAYGEYNDRDGASEGTYPVWRG